MFRSYLTVTNMKLTQGKSRFRDTDRFALLSHISLADKTIYYKIEWSELQSRRETSTYSPVAVYRVKQGDSFSRQGCSLYLDWPYASIAPFFNPTKQFKLSIRGATFPTNVELAARRILRRWNCKMLGRVLLITCSKTRDVLSQIRERE